MSVFAECNGYIRINYRMRFSGTCLTTLPFRAA